MPRRAQDPKRGDPEVDPVTGLSIDPNVFFRQQARRAKILRRQDVARPARTTPVAVRFDQFTLKRLKTLATLHNKGYQTLLKEFVVERLYEEEKRAGII
jgi:hypothetical protein